MGSLRILDEAGSRRVSDAVAAAERTTSGEIVTVLTERSDDYADVAMAWSVLVAFIALFVIGLTPDFYLGLVDRLTGGWRQGWSTAAVIELAALFAFVKFAGAWLIQLWPPLRIALVPAPIRQARVRQRAITAFRIGAERRTHGRTGILIYLSMREHRAEIVADEAIAGKVSDTVWSGAMAAMLAELRQGRIAEGMVAGVEHVAAILAEHAPRGDEDINELPDRLIEI